MRTDHSITERIVSWWVLGVVTVPGLVAGAPQGTGTDGASAARKLYDAAWKEPPGQIDIVLYRELMLKQHSPAEARQMVETALDAIGGEEADKDGAERKEEIEHNVQNILREQEGPRRMVQRVRWDGERRRIDQAILPPGKDLGPGVRLAHTWVQHGSGATVEGYRSFEYAGEGRSAFIHPDHTNFGGTPVKDWIAPPYVWVVRMMFGRPGEAGRILPDETKLAEFIASGGAPVRGMTIRVSPEGATGGTNAPRDRVEFLSAREGETRLIMALVCDRADYACVYMCQIYDPTSGRLLMLKQVDEYDANGLPVQFRVTRYDGSGRLTDDDAVVFLKANPNPAFGPDVFEFRPPPGYTVVDARQQPSQVISNGQDSAPQTGETLGDLLDPEAFGRMAKRRPSEMGLLDVPVAASQPDAAPGS